jgi:hypothetical protein
MMLLFSVIDVYRADLSEAAMEIQRIIAEYVNSLTIGKSDIIDKFLADHNHTDTGVHKPRVIKAAMIKFGNGDVNDARIPAGQSATIGMGLNGQTPAFDGGI